MTRVVVHIERLVLKDFRPQDGDAVAEGLQRELSRLLAEPGAAPQLAALGSLPRLQVGGVPLDRGAGAQQIGERLAQGVSREIVR